MAGIIGVLSLGVIATIVFQFVRQGSQGPALAGTVLTGVDNFYGTLMGK